MSSKEDALVNAYNAAKLDAEKNHEAYLVTLVFTILALAVQTSKFEGSPFFDGCELGAWILLLVGGLVGLNRQRDRPWLLWIAAEREGERSRLDQATDMLLKGTRLVWGPDPYTWGKQTESGSMEINNYISGVKLRYKILGDQLVKSSSADMKKQTFQQAAFATGIVSLMISRAWQPLSALVQSVW